MCHDEEFKNKRKNSIVEIGCQVDEREFVRKTFLFPATSRCDCNRFNKLIVPIIECWKVLRPGRTFYWVNFELWMKGYENMPLSTSSHETTKYPPSSKKRSLSRRFITFQRYLNIRLFQIYETFLSCRDSFLTHWKTIQMLNDKFFRLFIIEEQVAP